MSSQLARIFYVSSNKNISRIYTGSRISFKEVITSPGKTTYTGMVDVSQVDWSENKPTVQFGYVSVKKVE